MNETQEEKTSIGSGLLAVLVFVLVLVVGAIGFTVSWDNLYGIAEPYLSGDLDTEYVTIAWAHAIPAVVDGGIISLTMMRLLNAMKGRSIPFATWFLNALIVVTVVVNATAGDRALGMLLHALPAAVYVAVSETFIHSFLKRYKILDDGKPKTRQRGITLARWVLAPVSTFRMWRVMTISATDDLRVFVLLSETRATQHSAWRDEHGAAWWFPVLGVSRADRTGLKMRLLKLSVGTVEPENQNQETGSLVLETSPPVPGTAKPEPRNWVEPVLETAEPKPQNQVAPKPRPRNRVVEGTATETGTSEPLDVDGMTKEEKDAVIMQALVDLYDPDVTPTLNNMAAIAEHFHVGKARVVKINKQRLALLEAK